MGSTAALTKKSVDSAIKAGGLTFSDGAVISFPGDSSFTEATQRWNAYKGPSFSASITVATEKDVSAAVKMAQALKVGFLATASRHGYGMTMNRLQGGLAIDMSRLNSINISGSTITVGAGSTTENIINQADKAGYQIPVGSHTTLSIVGVTIGAGVNRWSGVHGLVCDNLISGRVVLHDGKTVEASESQNPDLFWALKGAGANFGIVVSATYKLQPAINKGVVLSVDAVLPLDQTKPLLDILKPLVKDQPPELAIAFYVLWNGDAGQPVIVASWTWHGSEEKGREVVAPLLALQTIVSNVRTIRWTEVIGADTETRRNDLSRVVYGVNLRQFDAVAFESAIEKLVKLYNDVPAARGSLYVIEFFPNNAVLEVPDETTAYPWRDAICNLMVQMSWDEPNPQAEAAAKALGEEVRQDFARTGGYDGLSVYVNYAVGHEPLENKYGKDKLPRLLELKAKWDPENAFRYHHPLVRE